MEIGDVVTLKGDPEVKMTVADARWERGRIKELECCWFDAGLRVRFSFFPVEMLELADKKNPVGFGDAK